MEKNTYKSDLQKKGDVGEVGNYRSICTPPALYKLFSTLIHTTESIPDLTVCNGRTREGFDVRTKRWIILRTYKLLDQKCHEWRIKMWVATVDLHESLRHDKVTKSQWNALGQCGIEPRYISFLRGGKTRNRERQSSRTAKSDVFEMKEENEAGRPIVQFALQHSTPSGTERRRYRLAID